MKTVRAAAASLIVFLTGCGGGGTTEPATPKPTATGVKIAIHWMARSRDVSAPSSALSAVVTLALGSPTGGDAAVIVDRKQDPAAYVQTVVFPSSVAVGISTLAVRFYAQSGGSGGIVGTATAGVRVKPDGSLTMPDGTPLGAVDTAGAITSVTLEPHQVAYIGQNQTLVVTARDAANNIVAVSPGSIFLSASDNPAQCLRINPDGSVQGSKTGIAYVTATVDGLVSSAIVVVTSYLQIQRINLLTNDLAFDHISGKLFASVPSADSTGHANQLVAIDPATGVITGSVFVGSEPNRIAISDDGHYLYVGLDGAAAIRRVDLRSMTADIQIPMGFRYLGGGVVGSTVSCHDIAVMPGSPHTIAVSLRFPASSPAFAGVVIFDDDKPRQKTIDTSFGQPIADWVAFGATPDRLYGYDSETSESELTRFLVNASGVSVMDSHDGTFGVDPYMGQLVFSDGLLYSSNGLVVNPETGAKIGDYPASAGSEEATNGFAIDASANRAYLITAGQDNGYVVLDEFDKRQFTRIASYALIVQSDIYERNVVPRLVSCGNGRLAFNTHGGQHPELGQVVLTSLDN